MPTITIGRTLQFETRVSDEDYEFLMQFLLTYAFSHPRGSLVYARRSVRRGGANVTILMHRVVLERMGKPQPTPQHTCDHDNGESLDNQRHNLFWRTPAQQMLNRRGHQAQPVAFNPPPF